MVVGKAAEWIADGGRRLIAEAQTDGGGLSCTHIQLILRSRFGPRFLGIHSVFIALNHVVVDSVFYVSRDVRTAEDPLIVGLIFCEQERDIPFTVQIPVTQLGMGCGNCLSIFLAARLFNDGLGVPGHHVQVLRNHSVGSTCNSAGSGPRFTTLIWISMSSGPCLAYSTKTSK